MKKLTLLILALVATWLGVVVFKAQIEARFSQWALKRANVARSGRSENPLYGEMKKLAGSYGLDVSFIQNARRTHEIDLSSAEIFSKPPGYYDVIIFGDSSLVWSYSPQLVAQASGKRVAFLGFQAALPNQSFLPLAEQVCDVYLKKHGTAVFLFDFWYAAGGEQQRTPDMLKVTRASEASVARQEFERAADAIFSVPHLAIYEDAIEPFFAPVRYKEQHSKAQGFGCTFYSWGARSDATFLHCRADNGEANPAGAHTVKLANTIVTSCDRSGDANMAANLTALAQSNIFDKWIAIPLADGPRINLVCETAKLKGKLGVLDLPRLAVEKYGITELEAQDGPHLANASSVLGSVVLGRALKDFTEKK